MLASYNRGSETALKTKAKSRVDDSARPRVEELRKARQLLSEFLRAEGLKQSAKRDTILEVFLHSREHLSTEELHHLVKRRDPSIGYTTVYRTLKLFAQCGLASEVDFRDGVARFEHSFNRRTHHHMVCTTCGNSVEFFAPEVEQVAQRIGTEFHFATARHNFQVFGTCDECGKKQRA